MKYTAIMVCVHCGTIPPLGGHPLSTICKGCNKPLVLKERRKAEVIMDTFRIESRWNWDGRIVGLGQTPRLDRHMTVMENIIPPTRLSLVFPIDQAISLQRNQPIRGMNPDDGLPLYMATRVGVDIRMIRQDA